MKTNYKNLKIWQMSFNLTLKFYDVLSILPLEESKNIIDQIRRACTSLPLNIAEGASSKTTKQFLNHLHYTYASSQELEVLLLLCHKLSYINEDLFEKIHDELDFFKRALYKFIVNVERKEYQKKFSF